MTPVGSRALWALLFPLAGCADQSFTCGDDAQCPGGVCELTGYCSFPDDGCESGRRYGEHGGRFAGVCVQNEDIDETAAGASTGAVTFGGDTGSSGGDPTDTPAESSSTGESGDATSSRPDGSSTGEAGVEPDILLIDSTPADGDHEAPIEDQFWLRFAEPVDAGDLTGRVSVQVGRGAPEAVVVWPCVDENDPACVTGQFPPEILVEGRLPSDTTLTVRLAPHEPSAPEQSVEFTTFRYLDNVWDNSGVIEELGGLAMDPTAGLLFVVGTTAEFECIARRADITGDGIEDPETVITIPWSQGGPYCYGASIRDERLYVAMSYDGTVAVYDHLQAAPELVEVIGPPAEATFTPNTLQEVTSVTTLGDRVLMGFGNYLGGNQDQPMHVLSFEAGTWSAFLDGAELWDPADAVMVAAPHGDPDHVFVQAGQTLRRVSSADGSPLEELEIDWTRDLAVDAAGRVWLGGDGLTLVDTNGALAVRRTWTGLPAGRIAVSASEHEGLVAYAEFRGPGRVGMAWLDLQPE